MLDHIALTVGATSRDYRARVTNAPKVYDDKTTLTIYDTFMQDGRAGRLVLIESNQLDDQTAHYKKSRYEIEAAGQSVTDLDVSRVIFDRILADKKPLLHALKVILTTPHIASFLNEHDPQALAQCAKAVVIAEAN